MIFEDIANVMNARPVKEIMRKTGLTKNRVYSLRMGCTFHMDYELLFALQRMGYEVRVFAVGDPARRSRDGDGKIPAPVGPVTARAVSRSEMEPNGDKRRVVGRGATLERSESGVGQNIGPAFWVCRAKSGAAFRCAKPPCAVVRFAAMASPPRTAILPFPSRLRRAGAPTAKPRRSLVTFLTLRK